MRRLTAIQVTFDRSGRRILHDVSLQFCSGSVAAIVGPNGSGKSTLLRCMANLWRPTSGRVVLGDHNLQALSRTDIARSITYVPQESRFEFEFSVREIVRMGRYAHRGRFDRETEEDRRIVDGALIRADVAHLADRSVTRLSGGEKQRVLIARSLTTRSPIILLDEPTANLDVDHALDVLDLCRSLADDGYAVAIATHDLNAVCRFADSVALLNGGSVVAEGSPNAVLTAQNLQHTFHVSCETLTAADGTSQLLFRQFANFKGVHHEIR